MFTSPPEATYRCSFLLRNLWILFLLPFGLVFYLLRDSQNSNVLGIVFITAVLSTLIVFIFFNRQELRIHAEGIARKSLLGEREIRWEDITETRYDQVTMAQGMIVHFGILGILLAPFVGRKPSGSKASQKLRVISSSGQNISLDQTLLNSSDAIRRILTRVNPRIMAEARKRLAQGDSIAFGKLSISPLGISWRNKQPVPYADVDSVRLAGGSFRVKLHGKWLDFVAVQAGKIPNIFVAIDLIQTKMREVEAIPGQDAMAEYLGT